MSLYVLAAGSLVGSPVERTSGTGNRFATASLRVATEDGAILASIIAFGDQAEQLLAHHAGAAIAVSGRAKLTSWTGKDGDERHGISVVVEQIASAASARRAGAERRRAREDAA